MDESKIIFNKDGLQFMKSDKINYKLNFQVENKNIKLFNIIDFSLIKLIYELNPDIYEKINTEIVNDNEIVLTLLIKHFFEDLGLPQRFVFLHIQKFVENNKITFISSSVNNYRPFCVPKEAEILNITTMTIICENITAHKMHFDYHILLNENVEMPEFAENIIGQIIHKIFKRVKQFIENVRI